jgi:hypothetical protein
MEVIKIIESENRVDVLIKIDDKKTWKTIKKRLKYESNIFSIPKGKKL